MSNLTQTSRPKAAAATAPTIYNLSMVVAGTEYPQALSSSTKKFTVRMRTNATARVSFVLGGTTTAWITIPACNSFTEENLDLSGVTIYLQSTAAGQIAEILEWS